MKPKSAIELKAIRDAKVEQKGFELILDREINDTDIWVIQIEGESNRFIGGKTSLEEAFQRSLTKKKGAKSWKCTAIMRFINKSGRNCEKFIKDERKN